MFVLNHVRPRSSDRPAARASRAFTLVELLVVIGIIAVLVAILLPSLAKAREQAVRLNCAARLHQMHISTVMYMQENKGKLPSRNGVFATAPHVMTQAGYDLHETFVKPYVGLNMRDKFMFCPGPLLEVRNPSVPNYVSKHVTYTYFAIAPQTTGNSRWLVTQPPNYAQATSLRDTTLWTCMTVKTPSENYLGHDATGGRTLPKGQNAVKMDGSTQWYNWSELEPAFLNTGNTFYWPIRTPQP